MMEKSCALFLLALSLQLTCKSQVVNETVSFDNYLSASDNDFVNRFDFGPGLNQIQTNGITGGCLETPQTISWGNDNAVYCTRFKGQTGINYLTGIYFRYDTLQLNSTNYDRAASIWMKPYTDPNHYLIATVSGSKRIEVLSYSVAANSPVMNLQQGHWYNLLLFAEFAGGGSGDQININSQVLDLGISGTDPPIPTGFANAILNDSILIADSAIEISITGTLWGGALYLDNFRFDGMKSFDNCVGTGVTDLTGSDFNFYIQGSMLTVISGSFVEGRELGIYNLTGQRLIKTGILSLHTVYRLDHLSPGIYLLKAGNEKRSSYFKIMLPQ